MPSPFPYYMYTVDSTNGSGPPNGQLTTTASAIQLVTEADEHLTDARGANADTFTVGATTYTFVGGFTTGTYAGDFVATSGGVTYFFSHLNNLAIGFDVNAQAGFVGQIGNQSAGTNAVQNALDIALTCFLPGTMIRTPDGDVDVAKLEIGQMVTTADGRKLPVKWIGRQTVALMFADPLKTAPICIKAGALDDNAPSRDLYTSAGHAMVLDGNLVIASALVNGRSIVRAEMGEPRITYYHVELDEHAVIFANDAATETYCDNVPREVFDNAAEYKALYPNAKPIKQMDLPTVKSQRQLPAATKKRLAARAAALAGNVSNVA